jgi:hypothetical protein
MHELVQEDLRQRYPSHSATWDLVEALSKRLQLGIERYGEPLRAHNGRDASQDLVEELLDASVYAMQCYVEAMDDGRLEVAGNWESIYNSLVIVLLDTARVRAGWQIL